jgi:hypothetical protein
METSMVVFIYVFGVAVVFFLFVIAAELGHLIQAINKINVHVTVHVEKIESEPEEGEEWKS